jgi:hypothetical protein
MLNDTTKTLAEALDAQIARAQQGPWVPACGGTEVAFRHGHYRYQYMFQASTRTHAYYCLDTDLILNDDEADRLFGH